MSEETITESGLKITVLQEGTGEAPKSGQTVLMHYELWASPGATSSDYDYENKKYIDSISYSTYDERNPFSGPIQITIGKQTPKDEIYSKGDSIGGLDEALLSMKVGAKCSLLIPPHLGYGPEGASSFHSFHGFVTPPSQPVQCNIELVSIIDAQESNKRSIEDQPENVAYEG